MLSKYIIKGQKNNGTQLLLLYIACIINIRVFSIGSNVMTTTDIVFHLYNTVLAGESTESIKQAQQELLSIESSPFFVYANMALLFAQSSPFPLKQFAATYLSNFVNRLLKKDKYDKKDKPSLQACSENLEKLTVMIRSPLLELQIKSLLKNPISELVHYLVDKGEQRTTRNQKFFKLILDAQRKKDGDVDFAFLAIYAQAYVCQQIHHDYVIELVKLVFPLLCKLALRYQQSVLTQPPASREQLPTILGILKEYSHLIKLYSRRFFTFNTETLAKFDFLIIEQLLVSAMQLVSPASVSGSILYTYVPDDEQTSKKINIYKANYLSIFSFVLKSLLQKQKKLSFPAFVAVKEIIAQVFGSTVELLKHHPYYQLKQDHMMHYLLDKAIIFLYWCCRHQHYSDIFRKISGQFVQKIIYPCLEFSPSDLEYLQEEDQGENFVSNLESITFCHVPQDYSWSDSYGEDSRYHTIKSTSANILCLLCELDKDLLEHLIVTASEVIKNNQRPYVVRMMLVLCIIESLCRKQPYLSQLVAIFKGRSLDIKDYQQNAYEQLQFSLLIKCVSHLDVVFGAIEKDKNKIADIGTNILLNPLCKSNSLRRLCIYIFQSIARQLNNSGNDFERVMLTIYNNIIPRADECLVYILVQYQGTFYSINNDSLTESEDARNIIIQSKQIHRGIKIITELIEKELKRENPREEVLKQVWKTFEQIKALQGMKEEFVALVEQALLRLLNSADLARGIEFQTKIYSIIISIIRQHEKINKNHIEIIKTIPRFFYSKNNRRFDGVMEIVLLFINQKEESSDLVHEFIKMALDEMNSVAGGLGDEDYGCEAVLVLHSIVTQRTSQLKKEHWQQIILTTFRSLEVVTPSNKQYFTNLIALLALALAYSYNHFSQDQNQLLIVRVLSNLPSFDVGDHASEALIFAFSQLIEIPDYRFVGVRFTLILDSLISLYEKNRSYRFKYHEPKTKYIQNLRLLKGPIKEVSYSFFFEHRIKKMKPSNLPIFQKSFSELTKDKQNYFYEHILGKKPAVSSKQKVA